MWIISVAQVAAGASILDINGGVPGANETILLVGADLAAEIKLKKWWEFTDNSNIEFTRVEKVSPIDPTKTTTTTEIEGLKENDVLIGFGVAEKLNKKPGDPIWQ